MNGLTEYSKRQEQASELFNLISGSSYTNAAEWASPPLVCYYNKRGRPVLLVYQEKGDVRRFKVEDDITRRTVERLVREKRIRRIGTHSFVDLEGAIPI
ncbi:hypothetical protein J4413_03490 [Candidatus Woesearchaeota archaeon]|nr:hypothetical protein [Candidatus Woesearchaeota archaeon]